LNIDDQMLVALYHVSSRGANPVHKRRDLYRAYPGIERLQKDQHRKPLLMLKGSRRNGVMENVKVIVHGDIITLTTEGVARAARIVG
jgi:hypothetical protein